MNDSQEMTLQPEITTEEYQRTMLKLGNQLVQQRTDDRRVANLGEYTQSVIAILVVTTTCYGVTVLHQIRMPPEFWTIVGLVIGFYFGRNRPLAAVRSPSSRERVTDKAGSSR